MNTLLLHFLFTVNTAQFNLPPELLSSLCFIESSHRVEVVHIDDGEHDSLGVCQIQMPAAKQMGFKGTEKELMKPGNNVYYAAKFLSYQIKRYNSTVKGVIAYNRGNAKGLTSTEYSGKVIKQWQNQTKLLTQSTTIKAKLKLLNLSKTKDLERLFAKAMQ